MTDGSVTSDSSSSYTESSQTGTDTDSSDDLSSAQMTRSTSGEAAIVTRHPNIKPAVKSEARQKSIVLGGPKRTSISKAKVKAPIAGAGRGPSASTIDRMGKVTGEYERDAKLSMVKDSRDLLDHLRDEPKTESSSSELPPGVKRQMTDINLTSHGYVGPTPVRASLANRIPFEKEKKVSTPPNRPASQPLNLSTRSVAEERGRRKSAAGDKFAAMATKNPERDSMFGAMSTRKSVVPQKKTTAKPKSSVVANPRKQSARQSISGKRSSTPFLPETALYGPRPFHAKIIILVLVVLYLILVTVTIVLPQWTNLLSVDPEIEDMMKLPSNFIISYGLFGRQVRMNRHWGPFQSYHLTDFPLDVFHVKQFKLSNMFVVIFDAVGMVLAVCAIALAFLTSMKFSWAIQKFLQLAAAFQLASLIIYLFGGYSWLSSYYGSGLGGMAPYLTLGVSWYLNIPAIVLLVLASAASSIGPQVEKEGDTKKRLLNAVSILQIVPLVLVIGLSIFAMLWVGWTVAQTGHMRGNMFGRRLYGLFGEGQFWGMAQYRYNYKVCQFLRPCHEFMIGNVTSMIALIMSIAFVAFALIFSIVELLGIIISRSLVKNLLTLALLSQAVCIIVYATLAFPFIAELNNWHSKFGQMAQFMPRRAPVQPSLPQMPQSKAKVNDIPGTHDRLSLIRTHLAIGWVIMIPVLILTLVSLVLYMIVWSNYFFGRPKVGRTLDRKQIDWAAKKPPSTRSSGASKITTVPLKTPKTPTGTLKTPQKAVSKPRRKTTHL